MTDYTQQGRAASIAASGIEAATEVIEYLDGDQYPTETALAALDKFEGSPSQLVELLRSMLPYYGHIGTEDFVDEFGNVPSTRLTIVTGGWSGCEEIVGHLSNTLFHYAFWESSWRGGKHTYVVPAKLWGDSGKWGNLRG